MIENNGTPGKYITTKLKAHGHMTSSALYILSHKMSSIKEKKRLYHSSININRLWTFN